MIEKLATEWKQLDPDNSACLIFICFDVNLLLLILLGLCMLSAGEPGRRDVERAVWLADSPSNSERNMPAQLPPQLARKASEMLEQNSAMGAGANGPVDFWKWANGRLAEEQVRARVPSVSRVSSRAYPGKEKSLRHDDRSDGSSDDSSSFDLDEHLDHVRAHLPEVSRHTDTQTR